MDTIRSMEALQLYAVATSGLQRLPIPEAATRFEDLYDGLALGVYSALRTFAHNKFLCLDAHLDRTKHSMDLMGWAYQLDMDQLRVALHQACTASPWPDARVRLDVLAEPAYLLGTDSRVLIALAPFSPISADHYEKGVTLGLAPGLARERPQAKLADFAVKRRAYADNHPEPVVIDYLILDEAGYILEGTGSNFYGVRDGVVYTAGAGVLAGITREIILGLLPELDIPLRLEAVHATEIAGLDEAGMSSSSRALLPVVKIDDQVIGQGRPGPICRRILAAYNAFVDKHIKTAISELPGA